MAFDFPAVPIEGQEFTPAGGSTYIWKAPVWLVKPGVGSVGPPGPEGPPGTGSGTATWVGDAPPAVPAAGQLWWSTGSGKLFIWFADINSNQWVQVALDTATPAAVRGAA